MSKINYDEVPGCYLHCTNADCKMANHCLRQLAMQHLPNNQIGVTILNPQLPPNGEKCEYYRDDKPQIYGKGFKNMQAKMLPGEYQTFMYRLQGQFARNPYFERRKGARLCSPKEMKEVEAVLKAINHEELKFDAYVEKLNWDD